jgi:N-acyl-D-aspartate/D-glutamate deacylase
MATTLIEHGTIVDGTGKAAFAGSVLIEDDRIAAIVPVAHLCRGRTVRVGITGIRD